LDDDQRWPSVWLILLMMIPGIGLRLARRRLPADAVTPTRMLFFAFSNAMLLFGLVIATLPHRPSGPVVPWVPIIAVIAVASLVANRTNAAKPLDCSSPSNLVGSYRNRLFLAIAFCEAVALFGFLLTFATGPSWIYYPAGAIAYAELWIFAAPTRASFARDDERLAASGCELSLLAILRGRIPPPPLPPGGG
jgi:F0F1-type ATP synthase membrane subunit c/vacuolar-type H+-ATPase subunit K